MNVSDRKCDLGLHSFFNFAHEQTDAMRRV
jgi:hypothetical protein